MHVLNVSKSIIHFQHSYLLYWSKCFYMINRVEKNVVQIQLTLMSMVSKLELDSLKKYI